MWSVASYLEMSRGCWVRAMTSKLIQLLMKALWPRLMFLQLFLRLRSILKTIMRKERLAKLLSLFHYQPSLYQYCMIILVHSRHSSGSTLEQKAICKKYTCTTRLKNQESIAHTELTEYELMRFWSYWLDRRMGNYRLERNQCNLRRTKSLHSE